MSCAQEEKKRKRGKKKRARAESLESVTELVFGAHHATEPLPVPALAVRVTTSLPGDIRLLTLTCGTHFRRRRSR